MIEIKKYNSDLEQAHIDFASKYWTKSRRKIPEYIYWKFRRKNNEDLSSFLLAVKDNVVIGQLGVIPADVYVDGKIYESQWACDLMVDNDYRGNGIAKLLYDFAHKQKEITFGHDPSPAAYKSMTRSGYKTIQASYKFLFSVNIGGILKLKSIHIPFFNHVPNLFLLFYWFWSKIRKQLFKKISKEQYQRINDIKNVSEFVSTVQDASFISWRYNTFKHYYKGIDTYANENGSSFSGFYADNCYYITNFKIIKLVHFFDIISQILAQYRKEGLLTIRLFCNDDNLLKKLPFLGFIKFRTRSKVIFYTENEDLIKKISDKKFYYTYSDSDENI